jgi:hypothetical protein
MLEQPPDRTEHRYCPHTGTFQNSEFGQCGKVSSRCHLTSTRSDGGLPSMHMTTHSPYHTHRALEVMEIRYRSLELASAPPHWTKYPKTYLRPHFNLYRPFYPPSLDSQHVHYVPRPPTLLNPTGGALKRSWWPTSAPKSPWWKKVQSRPIIRLHMTPQLADVASSV